jgi:shikimate dehydrogenase
LFVNHPLFFLTFWSAFAPLLFFIKGMNSGDELPVEVSLIAPGTFVVEVVMKSEITPFLRAAQERDCRIQPGTDMLFEMIPAYMEFFDLPNVTPERLRKVAKIEY